MSNIVRENWRLKEEKVHDGMPMMLKIQLEEIGRKRK